MVESAAATGGGNGGLFLPPGFRFHPTDEEVITSYLLRKVLNPSFVSRAVGEVDLNSCEPRDLPGKTTMGEKEWYFFVHKDMKYPTGTRANRATREGYWKATGKDREIFAAAGTGGGGGGGELVGMKKTLVFYTGRAPRGAKTSWVMHEFRLDGKSRDQTINNPKDEWVVCKVFNKKGEAAKMSSTSKAAAGAGVDSNGEYSGGGTTTPNAGSVVDAGEVGDFLDSMIDPLYFTNYYEYSSSLPAKPSTTTNAAAPPYNTDYYHYSAPTTTAAGSFNAMPNYSLTNPASNTAMTSSFLPTSSSGDVSSMLTPPGHGIGRSYNANLHRRQDDEQQAIMVKALEGLISCPDYGVPGSSAIAGVPQKTKLGSYDGEHAHGNYDLAAKNFGGRILHY